MVRLGVANGSREPLTIESIASNSSEFAPQQNSCLMAIAPGARCWIPVVFTPNDVGKRAGVLTITTNSIRIPKLKVRMSGTAKQGVVDIRPKGLEFFEWPQGLSSGEQNVTMTNNNPVPMIAPKPATPSRSSMLGTGGRRPTLGSVARDCRG